MRFSAFGLLWDATIPLPFAAAADAGDVDVHVTLEADLPLDPGCCGYDRTLHRDAAGWTLRFTGDAGEWLDYHFDSPARQLSITTSRRADQVWAALEGIVPAIMLADRGASLLHGSVVARGGGKAARGVAILGASGMGKSTLTATLAAREFAILTDDLIVFDPADAARVLAGSPRVGLLADAAAGVAALTPAGHRAAPGSSDDKLLFRAARQPPPSAQLSAIVVLQPFGGAQTRLRSIAGAEALAALRANSYGDWIQPPGDAQARHWLSLLANVPVFELHRPRDLGAIAAAADLLAAI